MWALISTPIGLMKWLADEVTIDGDVATFIWGDLLREHDTHTATVVEMVKTIIYVFIGTRLIVILIGK